MKLVPVYSARDTAQAHLLANVLKSNGVEAQVSGEALSTIAGYLPAAQAQVCVSETDQQQALPIVERFVRSGAVFTPKSSASWKCPQCGEVMEPQFTDCWNCQTPRPDNEDAAAVHVPRPTPDPQITFDLLCLSCRYNLRALSVDGRCPECGCPIFTSVFAKLRSVEMLADDPDVTSEMLQPCLDWFESRLGFPIEAIGFIEHVWRRAQAAAPMAGADAAALDYDSLFTVLPQLACEFVGDPLTARRALQRWNLRNAGDLRRLITSLIDLRVLAIA
jgi:predicted RNA-binding Zn-ribbon protein involved in translation (DUF1610 family)